VDSAALELSGELASELAANDEQALTDAPERFSTLKCFATSALHYKHARDNAFIETLSMRLGSGGHAMLFGTPYVVWQGKDRKAKGYADFEKENAGTLILTKSEERKAAAMAAAIRANPIASRLLFNGAALEQRIDWTWQGRAFRSTPDVAGRTFIVDLKCLRSADPDKVKWQSRDMHYNAQAALYRRALHGTPHPSGLDYDIKDCYLLVVENKAPYPVTMLRFTDAALEAGDRSCVEWMERLRECEERNEWPGYTGDVVDLDVPSTMDDFQFGDDDDATSNEKAE